MKLASRASSRAGRAFASKLQDGQELIDAFAGIYCNHVGYGRKEIADAIHEEALKIAYYHSFRGYTNEPAIRLGRRVLDMAPPGMKRIQFGVSGSDANETQLKIVWYYNNVLGRPEKKKSSRAGAAITAAPSWRAASPASTTIIVRSICRRGRCFTR